MKIEQLQTHKKILIVGYGVEGQATEKFLKKFCPAAQISTADEKDGAGYLDKQSDYDLAIRTPGVPKENMTIPYTTATNIFFANTKQKKIGITGSKGKSTTAKLIFEILRDTGYSSRLYGNIGTPMLEYFMGEMDDDDILVLELSSYQLDDITYSPHIAVMLNIYNDHVSYHGDFEKYLQAKGNIVKFSEPADYFIYNGAFPEISEIAKKTHARGIDFSHRDPSLSLRMTKNLSEETVRAARGVCTLFAISDDTFQKTVRNFSGLPHRLEIVGTFKGITFIDDSAATTPESTIFALAKTEKVGSLILGGLNRGADFSQLAQKVSEKNIQTIILFPDTDKWIKQALINVTIDESTIYHAANMENAVKLCYQHTQSGTVCLLSPGCASYTQYKNFPERGDMFKKIVQSYYDE